MSSALSIPGARGEMPQAVFTDFSTLNALRSGAEGSDDSDGSQLKEAARQFSSIFLHMALKSMRDASFGGGMLDSKQSEFYRDMFDQQLALDLSEGEGFGMTDLIVQQLSPDVDTAAPPVPALNAVQAYSRVAQTTPAIKESEDSVDNQSNSNKTTRLALP